MMHIPLLGAFCGASLFSPIRDPAGTVLRPRGSRWQSCPGTSMQPHEVACMGAGWLKSWPISSACRPERIIHCTVRYITLQSESNLAKEAPKRCIPRSGNEECCIRSDSCLSLIAWQSISMQPCRLIARFRQCAVSCLTTLWAVWQCVAVCLPCLSRVWRVITVAKSRLFFGARVARSCHVHCSTYLVADLYSVSSLSEPCLFICRRLALRCWSSLLCFSPLRVAPVA